MGVKPWDDPANPAFWLTRMVHATHPRTLTALQDQLRRTLQPGPRTTALLEQIERQKQTLTERN